MTVQVDTTTYLCNRLPDVIPLIFMRRGNRQSEVFRSGARSVERVTEMSLQALTVNANPNGLRFCRHFCCTSRSRHRCTAHLALFFSLPLPLPLPPSLPLSHPLPHSHPGAQLLAGQSALSAGGFVELQA